MAVATPTPAKDKEPGLVRRMVDFYHGVMAEMRKVTWPSWEEVREATVRIIIFVMVLAAAITLMDIVLQSILLKLIPSLFSR